MGNSSLPAKPDSSPWLCRIDFEDHAHFEDGDAHLLPCTVWGICYRETRKSFHVSWWACEGKLSGVNTENVAIGKKLIKKIEWIRRETA